MDISQINNVFVYNENQLTLSRPSLLISTLRKRVHRILRSMNAITLMLLRLKLCPISSKMDCTSLVIASTVSFLSSAVWNRIIIIIKKSGGIETVASWDNFGSICNRQAGLVNTCCEVAV